MAARQIKAKWYAAYVNGETHLHYGKWSDFLHLVNGKRYAKYKGFKTELEACQWLSQIAANSEPLSSTFPNICASDNLAVSTQINVYTDGSYLDRTKRAGWGYVVVKDDKELFSNSGPVTGEQTNNRGELTAILMTLYSVSDPQYTIWTDSQYSRNSVTKWYRKWKQNDWMTATGKPVKNVDLIRNIVSLLKSKSEITIRHIPAHKGHKWNEMADKLAKEAASTHI
jgi:ribonuclease HI